MKNWFSYFKALSPIYNESLLVQLDWLKNTMDNMTVSLNANTLTLPISVREKEGRILMCLNVDSHVHHLVAKQVTC